MEQGHRQWLPIAALLGNYYHDGAQHLIVTGSFWCSVVAMAAAIATIHIPERDQAIDKMRRAGQHLHDKLAQQALAHNVMINQTPG
ncbi:hypothetical protein AB833_01450 [Chromatiales bacterium (ex Bugula neritina AB1)]|nr:hypothetical protein AB833_01450 [Chromatiales bacterium (ex Bugula neritina AB1)]